MADIEGPGRARRGGILLLAAGAVLVVWVAGKLIASAGSSTPTRLTAANIPPYVLDGSPPWTWPQPGAMTIETWLPVTGYQPWPPEWADS